MAVNCLFLRFSITYEQEKREKKLSLGIPITVKAETSSAPLEIRLGIHSTVQGLLYCTVLSKAEGF